MKNQLKKSLSLIMAVLMILSCWVWVAPDKASAADEVYEAYTLEINVTVKDPCNGGEVRADVTHYANNGTGSATTTSWAIDECEVDQNEGKTFSVKKEFTGWPGKVYFLVDQVGVRTQEIIINYIAINGKTVLTGTWTLNPGHWGSQNRTFLPNSNVLSDGKYGDGTSGTVSDEAEGTWSWPRPTVQGISLYFNGDETATSIDCTAPKLGDASAKNVTPTLTYTALKDNYGVKWANGKAVDISAYGIIPATMTEDNQEKKVDLTDDLSITSEGYTRTLTIGPEIQKKFPRMDKTTIYVTVEYKTSSTVTAVIEQAQGNILLNFPTYTAYFYPNGGTIGTSKTNNTSSDDNPIAIGDKVYYDSAFGDQPPYAAKEGMELKGYYNYPNADATGLVEQYIGDEFNPVVDDKKIYTVANNGDTHWYAAWKAKTINATFMVGNQLLGTLEGRYNNSMLGKEVNGVLDMYVTEGALNTQLHDAYVADGKDAISFDENNNPVLKVGSTAYVFNGWKITESYDESQILKGDLKTPLKGDVVFSAQFIPESETQNKYTVTFYNGKGGVSKTGSFKFREYVTVPGYPPSKASDDYYTYEFAGWAKYIGEDFYAVDEEGKDADGAYIPYTSKDTEEFIVTEDAEYVPVFKMIPQEYTVTFDYTLDGGIEAVPFEVDGYNYGDNITFPEEIKDSYTKEGRRFSLISWTVNGDESLPLEDITVTGDMTLTANYDTIGELAEYTIRFFDKDGNLIDEDIYQHNTLVTAPTYGDGEGYDIPQTIDTEDSLYTFVAFKDKNGNPYSTTATADADYTAAYDKKDYADIHYYNYDGTLIYELDGKENSFFVGEKIRPYSNIVDGENKLPEREEDEVGTYTFTGWKDSSGNVVTPGTDVFTGDTYLNAQYERTDKIYTVEFLNDDEVVLRKNYKYGEAIEIPATDPTKESDDYYVYSFWAWSPTVSPVCYGDATYSATYRRTPIYYSIKWFNNKLGEITTSMYAYDAKIQQAIAPAAPIDGGDPETGYSWALKEWVRCDEAGRPVDENGNVVEEANAQKYYRGMKMPKVNMYFYPVYEQVAGVHTVTFFKEDGVTRIGEKTIAYNEPISENSEEFLSEIIKTSTDDVHFMFDKWVKTDGTELSIAIGENGEYIYENKLDENGDVVTDSEGNPVQVPKYIITGDVQVKPAYTEENHNKVYGETVLEPTCIETGVVEKACSTKYCTLDPDQEILPIIPDDDAPSGQVYVGTNKWTYNQFGSIDYSEKVYVGASANTIVNAEDNGTYSPSNLLIPLKNRGVGKIDYFISEEVVDNPATDISVWTNIYNYETVYNEILKSVLSEKGITESDYSDMAFSNPAGKRAIVSEVEAIFATYNANATGILGELGLENGKEYVIYIRLSDREVSGDVNVSYFSTGTIHYGTQAAEIEITGDGYGTKFCAEATVSVTDDIEGFKTYIDGEEVTLTDGKYICNEQGVHTVTVVDRHGNKSTKAFEIKGMHTYRNYTVAATCLHDGSNYDLCTVCGVKSNVETLTALGHSYTVNYTDKAPTCVVDGYRTYVCDNNCGEKLIVGPASAAEDIAKAKKYVIAEGETEGEWVSVTAADLEKDLKATGEHTYAKVQDENGKDTEEDAWTIDKAATCKVEGKKHKDCTKCGERLEEVIPVDTTNGHKFYRARVEDGDEPTCTTAGKKTQTCKYCGYNEMVEEIDALGHVAGEYKVTLEATCEAKGSKILTCSRCDAEIGEPVETDGVVTGFGGNAVEIPALGHAMAAVGDPYEGADGKWYQKYECSNGCGKTEDKETVYEQKVEATVTFDANGGILGYTTPETEGEEPVAITTTSITKYVGDVITVAQVGAEPTKAADATYKYTFSHWATRTGDGTEASPYVYTEVTFPITIAEGGATYYAVYAEKNVKYIVTYFDDTGAQIDKEGYFNNGDVVELAEGPKKAETALNTYTFTGWAQYVNKVDENGDVVLDDNGEAVKELKVVENNKVTIDGANAVVYATYKSAVKQYAVTFAYSADNTISTFMINAGLNAANHEYAPKTVSKDADSKYHYTFAGWNRAAQLASVESNIYTTPNFTAVAHELKTRTVTDATCTAAAVVEKYCDCGYKYTTTGDKALGHNWSETSVYDEATGQNIRKCQNADCNETTADTRTFTLNFYYSETVAENANPDKEVGNVAWGTKVDKSRIPVAPEKAADSQYTYTFKGWAFKDDTTKTIQTIENLVIKSDYDFVPVYEKTARTYTVIFAYEYSHSKIEQYTVNYGGSAAFAGATPKKENDTDPNYDPATYHYTFKGWSGATTNISKDTIVYAKFDSAEHTYGPGKEVAEATCQQGKGYEYTCTVCGHVKSETGKALDHNYVEVERVAPANGKDGYVKYECDYIVNGKKCGTSKTEVLKYEDSAISITVNVMLNGSPKSGVKVMVQAIGEDKIIDATTNANGIATVVGDKNKTYVAWVEIDGEKISVSLAKDGKGNYAGEYSYTESSDDCSCACHRDNAWGAIFRFFHKIIKLFTGEFKCCSNPDPMYG